MNFSEYFLSPNDYFLTQEPFELWKDPASGLLKTLPQPKQLDRFYESEDYFSHDNNNATFFARCYNAVKVINLRSKTTLAKRYAHNGNVLDIGAGSGDLVKSLRREGMNAVGFEPSVRARAVAAAKGIGLLDTYPETVNAFKLVTMYHVLEHVPDVVFQLKRVHGLLENNGHLILALPNYKSFDARYFKKFWAGYDVPRHLYHFDRTAVHVVCKDYFEVIKTKSMWFDSFYVSILSARYKKVPAAFLVGICIGMWSNMVAIVSKEPSSITYVLKKRI